MHGESPAPRGRGTAAGEGVAAEPGEEGGGAGSEPEVRGDPGSRGEASPLCPGAPRRFRGASPGAVARGPSLASAGPGGPRRGAL